MNENNLKTGWVSPNGDLWECNVFDHIAKADEIIDKYRYATLQYRASDEVLMANGWVHISISQLSHEYRIWWNKFLTLPQRNFLKQYFENAIIEVHNFVSCGLYGFEDFSIIPMLINGYKRELSKFS